MIKRLINDKARNELKKFKKFKGKSISSLKQSEKDELLEIIAKKLNII